MSGLGEAVEDVQRVVWYLITCTKSVRSNAVNSPPARIEAAAQI